ncbi:hypothetical protein CEXT_210301, partial [Caerostris extrusa]
SKRVFERSPTRGGDNPPRHQTHLNNTSTGDSLIRAFESAKSQPPSNNEEKRAGNEMWPVVTVNFSRSFPLTASPQVYGGRPFAFA